MHLPMSPDEGIGKCSVGLVCRFRRRPRNRAEQGAGSIDGTMRSVNTMVGEEDEVLMNRGMCIVRKWKQIRMPL